MKIEILGAVETEQVELKLRPEFSAENALLLCLLRMKVDSVIDEDGNLDLIFTRRGRA